MENNVPFSNGAQFHIWIRTKEQLAALIDFSGKNDISISRITLDCDFVLTDDRFVGDNTAKLFRMIPNVRQWCISLPENIRLSDSEDLHKILLLVEKNTCFDGIICCDLEGLGYLIDHEYPGNIYADHSIYLWNSSAVTEMNEFLDGACLPLELKGAKQRDLIRACKEPKTLFRGKNNGSIPVWEKFIYGHIPMMVTAGCVAKTMTGCKKNVLDANAQDGGIIFIKDRLSKYFPVLLKCRHCMNIIYNSVPLSLHKEIEKWISLVLLRLHFTTESYEDTYKILKFYFIDRDTGEFPFAEYTTGYEKRGVE